MATSVATASSSAASTSSASKPTPKQMQGLVDGLNAMRQEQRQLSSRLNDLEGDMNEHRLVIDALKGVDETRKCFRMVGGVLIEQKVKDVIPDLEKNHDLLTKTCETYDAKMKEKGTQINEYVKNNNLVDLLRGAQGAPTGPSQESTDGASTSKAGSGSVLV